MTNPTQTKGGTHSGSHFGEATFDSFSMVASIPLQSLPTQQAPFSTVMSYNGRFESSLIIVSTPIHTIIGNTITETVEALRKELQETYNLLETNLFFHTHHWACWAVSSRSWLEMPQPNGVMGVDLCASIVAKSVVWFFWYKHMLDIKNQTHGIEEDKSNTLPTK